MTRQDVVNFARLVLTQCDGAFSRDKKGYDRFDAVTVRQLLNSDIFGVAELADEEVECLRLKLLRYKKQIRKIASEHGLPEDDIELTLEKLDEPICDDWVIAKGQTHGGVYGRISLKWIKENFG